MLTRMARMLTHMLTRMTRWLAYYTHSLVKMASKTVTRSISIYKTHWPESLEQNVEETNRSDFVQPSISNDPWGEFIGAVKMHFNWQS